MHQKPCMRRKNADIQCSYRDLGLNHVRLCDASQDPAAFSDHVSPCGAESQRIEQRLLNGGLCTLKRTVKDQTVCFVKAFEVLMMIWSSDAHDALCPRVCYCHGGKLTRRQPQKLLPYGWPRQCLRTAALTFVQRKWYKSVPMIYLLQANYPRLLSWIY